MAGNNRFQFNPPSLQPDQIIALREARESWCQADNPVARLYRRVCMTLSLEKLIGLFAEELGRVLPFGQMVYRHRLGHQELVFTFGLGGAHRCDYQLNLEGCHYGTLSLTRRARFSEDELEAIEFLLSILICPLRNACQYALLEQAALTAPTVLSSQQVQDVALTWNSSTGGRQGDPSPR